MSLQSQYPGPIWQNYTQQTQGPATAYRPQPHVPLSQSMQPRQTPVQQNPASAPDPMQQAAQEQQRKQMEQVRMRLGDPNFRQQLAMKFAEMYPAPPPGVMPQMPMPGQMPLPMQQPGLPVSPQQPQQPMMNPFQMMMMQGGR